MLRTNSTLTSAPERRILDWLCRRMPGWVTSDMLTLLGLLGSTLAFCGYCLSRLDKGFLWLAIGGIALNWLGDSLDGTLARYRQCERPRYGFFIDHMTDTIAISQIAIGIGLSPGAHLISGLAILLAYYAMVIFAMTACIATGVFRISFSGLGPTEIRLFIMLCTFTGMVFPVSVFALGTLRVTIYDVIMAVMAFALLLTCLLQTIATARQLAKIDPPVHHDV